MHVQPSPNLARHVKGLSRWSEVYRQVDIVQSRSLANGTYALWQEHLNSSLSITLFFGNLLISFFYVLYEVWTVITQKLTSKLTKSDFLEKWTLWGEYQKRSKMPPNRIAEKILNFKLRTKNNLSQPEYSWIFNTHCFYRQRLDKNVPKSKFEINCNKNESGDEKIDHLNKTNKPRSRHRHKYTKYNLS